MSAAVSVAAGICMMIIGAAGFAISQIWISRWIKGRINKNE